MVSARALAWPNTHLIRDDFLFCPGQRRNPWLTHLNFGAYYLRLAFISRAAGRAVAGFQK